MDIKFSLEDRRMMAEMQAGLKDGKLKLNEYSCSSPSIFNEINKPEECDMIPEFTYDQYKQDIDPTNTKQDNEVGSFKQGTATNCWFLGNSDAAQGKDPSFLNGVINQKEKDEYSVKFPGEEAAVSVSEKELKSVTEFSTGDKDVRILEIATDKVYEKKGKDFKHDSGSAEDFQALFYPGKKTIHIDPKISSEEDLENKKNLETVKSLGGDIEYCKEELKKDPNNKELGKLLEDCNTQKAFWNKKVDEHDFSANLKDPAGYIKSAVADQNKIVTLSFKKSVDELDIVPQHAYSIDKDGFLVNPHDTNKKTKIHFNSVLSNPVVSFGIIER